MNPEQFLYRHKMNVSIMITTRNRCKDLSKHLEKVVQMNPAPFETIVTVDGCIDETELMLKSKYPFVKLIINPVGKGSVASRNRMMHEAKGDLVLALDDDSYPEQANALDLIRKCFAENSKLAVLHFPQRTDEYPETLSQTDFGPVRQTRSFANSGAVLRRDVYLSLPGFEPRFFHMYEEPDYALQCVAAGYEILYHPGITIRHHFSGATRNEIRNHHRHARNEFWSTMMRCPFPQIIGLAGYRIFSEFRYSVKRGPAWIFREPIWWWQALGGIGFCLKKRHPIPWPRYRHWLRLETN